MSYKDREQYLGFSQQLGYLDKGGKWRKKDWWISKDNDSGSKITREEQLRFERDQSKKLDNLIMKFKLGERDPFLEGCNDVAAIIAKFKSDENKPNLTTNEMK